MKLAFFLANLFRFLPRKPLPPLHWREIPKPEVWPDPASITLVLSHQEYRYYGYRWTLAREADGTTPYLYFRYGHARLFDRNPTLFLTADTARMSAEEEGFKVVKNGER